VSEQTTTTVEPKLVPKVGPGGRFMVHVHQKQMLAFSTVIWHKFHYLNKKGAMISSSAAELMKSLPDFSFERVFLCEPRVAQLVRFLVVDLPTRV
jgi:hypothetical protein